MRGPLRLAKWPFRLRKDESSGEIRPRHRHPRVRHRRHPRCHRRCKSLRPRHCLHVARCRQNSRRRRDMLRYSLEPQAGYRSSRSTRAHATDRQQAAHHSKSLGGYYLRCSDSARNHTAHRRRFPDKQSHDSRHPHWRSYIQAEVQADVAAPQWFPRGLQVHFLAAMSFPSWNRATG